MLVAIVDDHADVTGGLRALFIQRGWSVVLAHNYITGLEQLLGERAPDLAVVDWNLDGKSGCRLISQALLQRPQLRCMVHTAFPSRDIIVRAREAGAFGVTSKLSPIETVAQVADHIMRYGGWHLDPVVAKLRAAPDLEEIQRAVLFGMANGYSAEEIAHELGISVSSVKRVRAVLERQHPRPVDQVDAARRLGAIAETDALKLTR